MRGETGKTGAEPITPRTQADNDSEEGNSRRKEGEHMNQEKLHIEESKGQRLYDEKRP